MVCIADLLLSPLPRCECNALIFPCQKEMKYDDIFPPATPLLK